jgi:hypothetical protein
VRDLGRIEGERRAGFDRRMLRDERVPQDREVVL